MSALPYKLAEGDHRVIFPSRLDDPIQELRECIDRDYVFVKFTETRGGTEIGFRLDQEHSDLSGAGWEHGNGKIRLAGNLSLDYVKVRVSQTSMSPRWKGQGILRFSKRRTMPAKETSPNKVSRRAS